MPKPLLSFQITITVTNCFNGMQIIFHHMHELGDFRKTKMKSKWDWLNRLLFSNKTHAWIFHSRRKRLTHKTSTWMHVLCEWLKWSNDFWAIEFNRFWLTASNAANGVINRFLYLLQIIFVIKCSHTYAQSHTPKLTHSSDNYHTSKSFYAICVKRQSKNNCLWSTENAVEPIKNLNRKAFDGIMCMGNELWLIQTINREMTSQRINEFERLWKRCSLPRSV